MTDESPRSPLGNSGTSFEESRKFGSRSQSVAFTKKSTDNAQLEQSFRSSNLAKERATAHEQMLAECRFEPAIKGLPKSYGPNKTAGTLVYNRLTKWERNREVDIKQKKILRAHEEVKDCTFKPRINKSAHKQATEKPATIRLYEESSLIASNKARLAEELRAKEIEKQTEECTFKPRLSTRRTAWANVEPKYYQTQEPVEKIDPDKENYTYTPKVNEIPSDMLSARVYVNRDVTDRLTRNTRSSPVQKPKPQKERTIIDINSFLAGPVEIEECLNKTSRHDDNSSLQESPFTSMKDSTLLEESEQGQPALMSAMERERRKDNFQQFLSRQHAAQEKKKIQVEELAKSLFPKSRFEVNEESKKIISKSQKGEFMERLQHDVELRKDRKAIVPEEFTFKPTLNKSYGAVRKYPSKGTTANGAAQATAKPVANTSSKSTGKHNSEKKSAQSQKHSRNMYPPPPPPPPPMQPSPSKFGTSLNKKKSAPRPPADPNKYIQQHEKLLVKRKEMQEKALAEKAELELEDCTFAPRIKECPKFVSNIAKSISVVKSVRTTTGPPPPEEWK